MCSCTRLLNYLYRFRQKNTMKSIWDSLLLWGKERKPVLPNLRKEFGPKCKGGRKSFCLKLGRRWWSRQWFKLFPRILWVYLSFQLVYAKILKPWFESSSGFKEMVRKSTRLNGVRFVLQNPWEVWALEIYRNLIMPCLLNKCGGCHIKGIR